MSLKHRAYFNEKAAVWDQMMAHKPHEKLKETFKDLKFEPGSKVLDVGTGTGVMLPILQEMVGLSGKITAFDLAEEMLSIAKIKNGQENIDYVQGDIEAAPFEDNTFDAVICNSCFPHFLNQAASICEMARILKPGGRVVICHLSSRQELNAMHRSLGGVVGNDFLPDEKVMMLMFNQAGFSGIRVDDLEDRYILTANWVKV
ncbi:MAG: methyltransferase domain-containing protein [Syntrophomonas sp.]